MLQHLYIARRDLFNLIDDTIKAQKSDGELINKVETAVKIAINKIGKFRNIAAEVMHISFDAMGHIISYYGTPEWQSFTVTQKGSVYYVSHPASSYYLVYDKLQTAKDMRESLNKIGAMEDIAKDIIQYQTNKKLRAKCNEALEELISSIQTVGNIPHGACGSCISKYDGKESKKFKEAFSELEQTEVYKAWVK